VLLLPRKTQFAKKLYNSLFAEISVSPAVSNPKLLKTHVNWYEVCHEEND